MLWQPTRGILQPNQHWRRPQTTVAYTGPGDIETFTAWYGFRAYSAATTGTAAIRVIRASDSTQTDINTLSDGSLDSSTLATFLTSTTGKVVTVYDQVGTNHITQATDGNRPAVTASALNSAYGMTFTAASSTQLISGSSFASQAIPYAFVTVIKGTGTKNAASLDTGGYVGVVLEMDVGAGGFRLYAGVNLDVSATSGTWYAFQGIANGASSVYNING